MKNQKIKIVWILFCLSNLVQAGGRPGFEFLRIGYSARFSGLADNSTALIGDLNSIFYNPAGLAPISGKIASATYIDHLLDFNSGFIGYVMPFQKYGNLAIGSMYMNYGDFQEADLIGNLGGTFSASDIVLGVSFSSAWKENIYYGVTFKFINSTIGAYSSRALAADLGILYLIPASNLNLGLSIRNIGTVLTAFDKTKESLPFLLDFGISKKLQYLPVVMNVTFPGFNDEAAGFGSRISRYAIGFEGTFYQEALRVRLGYNHQRQIDLKDANTSMGGFSFGVGFFWKTYQFDYAYSPFGELGNVNRFGITRSF